jgi:hypothetical protein
MSRRVTRAASRDPTDDGQAAGHSTRSQKILSRHHRRTLASNAGETGRIKPKSQDCSPCWASSSPLSLPTYIPWTCPSPPTWQAGSPPGTLAGPAGPAPTLTTGRGHPNGHHSGGAAHPDRQHSGRPSSRARNRPHHGDLHHDQPPARAFYQYWLVLQAHYDSSNEFHPRRNLTQAPRRLPSSSSRARTSSCGRGPSTACQRPAADAARFPSLAGPRRTGRSTRHASAAPPARYQHRLCGT